MFTSIFGYGPGSGTLKLWIRIRQKFRILEDPDQQRWFYFCKRYMFMESFYQEDQRELHTDEAAQPSEAMAEAEIRPVTSEQSNSKNCGVNSDFSESSHKQKEVGVKIGGTEQKKKKSGVKREISESGQKKRGGSREDLAAANNEDTVKKYGNGHQAGER
jgi:hypothetical protein